MLVGLPNPRPVIANFHTVRGLTRHGDITARSGICKQTSSLLTKHSSFPFAQELPYSVEDAAMAEGKAVRLSLSQKNKSQG